MELAELTRKAAGVDVTLAADAELLAAAVHLESVRAAVDAAAGHVVAELEARGVCDRDFGLTTASWLAHETHGSRPVIAGRVRVASKLRQLSVTDEALSDGAITADHARVLADAAANPRVESHIVDLQDELVGLAQRTPFPAWRTHVSRLVELLDQDGGFDPDRDLARNHLSITNLGPDHLRIHGELVGEHALSFTHLLETETDRQWRQARTDHDHADLPSMSRTTLRALALVALLRHGAATPLETTTAPTVDITLMIQATQPDRIHTPEGEPLRPHTYRHLACDPMFTPIVASIDGTPLTVGRTTRLATPAQRRALAARDGGCVFPGCDMPTNWCDAHHITPWQAAGSTDLANLASLCRHHHGVTHRTGWTMVANPSPNQTFTWTTPTHTTLTSQRNRGSPGP